MAANAASRFDTAPPLPADLLERAAVELGETPQSREDGLRALHEYYDAHPQERPHRMDAPYLLMFLRHAKFDTAHARGRLDAMERWLTDCGEEIGDITKIRGTDFVELYEQGFMGILTSDRRTRDGSCIHMLLPHKMVALRDPSLLLRWSVWMLMRGVHDPYIQVCGQVIVESVEHYSLFQALRFRQVPREVTQKNLRFAQECMPFRLRGIWVTHLPAWVEVLLAIVRPFLSSKLRPRVRLLGSSPSALAALVDLALLPRELGGSHADAGQEWFRAQLRAEAEAAEGRETGQTGDGGPASGRVRSG